MRRRGAGRARAHHSYQPLGLTARPDRVLRPGAAQLC